MKDFTIVIAHRGDPMGLWATIHSCEIELEGSGLDYEYSICINGEAGSSRASRSSLMGMDLERVVSHLSKAGKLGHLNILQRPISPPTARQLATENAQGRILFFFDNHCLVGKDYFKRSLYDFSKYGMDMLHSTTKFFSSGDNVYHYKLKLEKNFWAEGSLYPDMELKPYRIAAGGHGGFAVRSDVWREVGGYWKGFEGYGGEEIYFDLKMAFLGKTNWIDPQVVHYHYAGTRPYGRHYTPGYYRNALMCANIVGGESWTYKVYESFVNNYIHPMSSPMITLLEEAQARSKQHAEWFASIRSMSLDELLDSFRRDGVAFN